MSADWGVAQIARVILPRMAGGGDAIIMSMGYFDDSGTHGSSEVVVWGGLMGTESQWLKFEKDWKAKLAEPLPGKPPLRRFHMTDCMARDQEFRGYSDPEKNAVIHDFRQIILGAGVYGYAAAVVIADWNEILGGKSYGRFGDADFFCMNLCVMHAARFARDFTEDRFISLVFDDRKEHAEANRLVLSIFEEAYNTHRGDEDIAGISFLPNVKFVPLQGADMIAWETYNHAKTWRPEAQTSERAHLRRFFGDWALYCPYGKPLCHRGDKTNARRVDRLARGRGFVFPRFRHLLERAIKLLFGAIGFDFARDLDEAF